MVDLAAEFLTEDNGPVPPALSAGDHFRLCGRDLAEGMRDWRIWTMLGLNDVKQRYRRSRIGQFWITLSMAVFIGATGFVYAYLFHTDIHEYLPFLAVGFIAWSLISAMVLESCAVFTASESYIRQVPIAKSVFVNRMLFRNLLIFLHNAVIIPPLFILFDLPVGPYALLSLIGILLVMINGFWIALLLGPLCTRFRDLPQILTSAMQIVFFLTPIMWRRGQLSAEAAWLTEFNPFARFLALIRDPLLGQAPTPEDWLWVGLVTLIGYAVAIPFFARFRARIVYWL
jgi:ABC-type polysaccharide/polyol phosphate export permease